MIGIPRRSFLALTAGLGISVAGCTRGSNEGSAGTETPAELSSEQVIREQPSCGSHDVSHIYSVTPEGITIQAASRSSAEEIRTTIQEQPSSEISNIAVKPWGIEEDSGYAVEIRRPDIPRSATELRDLLESRENDWTWRFGLSLRTNAELVSDVKSKLNQYDGTRVELRDFRIVVPQPTRPVHMTALMEEGRSGELFETASRFRISLVPENGDPSVLDATDVTSARKITLSDDRPGVQVKLSEGGRSTFVEFIDGQNEGYLTRSTSRFPFVVNLGDETLWEGTLSRELLHEIDEGSWENTFVFTVNSRAQAEDITDALGLMELPFSAETGVWFC